MSRGLNILVKTSSEYEVLDVFKDENITIKETVKDFRDIKKVFTSLSRSFTVPASKRNNRILGHFYRGDLYNVDSRALIDAKLTLNGANYKFGNVSLEHTKFKDNEPYSYTLRFYGNLTELNKKIGEDELTDLDTSLYNLTNPNFLSQFQSSTSIGKALAFPLMSRDRRFISHSGDHDYAQTQGYTDTANVSYSTSTRAAGYYGVIAEDLVGAIWVGSLLDCIENKYGLNFTGVLKDADYVRELRLLLQKRGGDGLDGSSLITKSITNFSPSVTKDRFSTDSNGFNITTAYQFINASTSSRSDLEFTVSTTSSNFKVNVKRDGETIYAVENTGTFEIDTSNSDFNNSQITFEVEASGSSTVSVSSTFETWTQAKATRTNIQNQTISGSASFSGSGSGDYIVKDNLPTMKVIDFLSDIFKRFNIVATVDVDLNVDTKHFDYYINQGNTIDISKYVDISNYEIGRPNFHSGIRFTTESVKTVGEYGFQKVNGRKYGELKYDLNLNDVSLDGDMYTVDLKSNIIPVDALIDINSGLGGTLESMILVDRRGEETELGATFFYTKVNDNRDVAYDTGFSVARINSYIHIPSEVYYKDELVSGIKERFVIGNYFSSELSALLFPQFNFKDSNLFNAFYSKSVSVAFGESSRRAKYDAYLPLRFLNTLSTADTIIVANKTHIIESYSTNFLTGKTSFVLIQVNENVINSFKTESVNVVDGSSSKSANFISADTGLATQVFTDNTTSHNVVGGESGIYRVQD